MLQHVDAMLIGVDSVDMVSKNSNEFLRALLMHVACVALCWLCWRCRHRNTIFGKQMEAIDDSVDRCCNMLMLCWLVLIVLIWFQKMSYVFLRGLLTGVARDAWCWLCWHSWQRETGFETDPEPLMLVHLHVATWCYMLTSVDKCWWKCWI